MVLQPTRGPSGRGSSQGQSLGLLLLDALHPSPCLVHEAPLPLLRFTLHVGDRLCSSVALFLQLQLSMPHLHLEAPSCFVLPLFEAGHQLALL